MGAELLCTLDDGVAVVTLNRPTVRNALSGALRAELRVVIDALDADPAVGAIVLTGKDPAFCAGVDLRELKAGVSRPEEIGPLQAPFLSCGTPLIGAVNGHAYTGGLELALACHFLIASERATFADTHARLGLMPGWGLTVLLPGAIGSRRARQMSVSCEAIDAPTALQWGLVNKVVPHSALMTTCMAIARLVCHNDTTAVHRVSALYDHQAAVRDAVSWRLESSAWCGPQT